MPRLPDDLIQRLKTEIPLTDLCREYGIELKGSGKNILGKCPFHDDDEPSFAVTPSKNLWNCLAGCGGGDTVKLVMMMEKLSFRHAAEKLAMRIGVSPEAEVIRTRKGNSYPILVHPEGLDDGALLNHVTDFYHQTFLNQPNAMKYLQKRKCFHPEAVKKFRIGYANRTLGYRVPTDTKVGHALKERLKTIGIFGRKGHEHLAGSVVFPILGPDGEPTQFYGRKVTSHLRKGTPRHLYLEQPKRGIWNKEGIQNQDDWLLCESIIDALTLWTHGLRHVTCAFGVRGFNQDLWELAEQSPPKRIIICYDNDSSGSEAIHELAPKLAQKGIESWRFSLPESYDINRLAMESEDPQSVFQHCLNASYLLEAGLWAKDKSTSTARSSSSTLAADLAAPLSGQSDETSGEELQHQRQREEAKKKRQVEVTQDGEHWQIIIGDRRYRVSGLARNSGFASLKITLRLWFDDLFHLDQIDLCHDLHRRKFIERAAIETGLDQDTIKRDLGRLLLTLEDLQEKRFQREDQPEEPEMTPAEKTEAIELLQSPHLMERIGRDFENCGVVGEEANRLVGYLACTSRLLRRPLAVIVQSTSAAGKSTLMEAILAMFPEEESIKYSAMTGQSLYYLGETNLKHKILAIVEEEGAERASYALKLLQSEGELTIASTGKNPKTGQMETQTYRVEGPVMIFLTTTAIDIDEELQNRALTLSIDESLAQTQRIHEIQRAARTLAGLERSETRSKVLQTHRNAQRLLESFPIWNPYVEQLTFTSQRTRTRRDHEKYLTLIDAVTLLHQQQRNHITLPSGSVALEATIEDIAIANQLAPEVLGRSLDELPPQTRKLWDTIKEMAKVNHSTGDSWKDFHFTRRQVREAIGWSVTQVRIHLERLHELEYLVPRSGRNGIRFDYRLLIDPHSPDGLAHIGLIDPSQLQLRLPPDGKKAHLTSPDKSPKSGSKQDGSELCA